MTKYTTIELDGLKKAEADIVNAVINEGRLREKEEILAKIERKINEAYANHDRNLAEFLYELIRDLDLDF